MSQTELLLFLTLALPLVNCLAINFFKDSKLWVNISYKSFPVLFLMNLVGLFNSNYHNISLNLIGATESFSLSFAADKMTMIFLLLFGFIWVIFAFYSSAFLEVEENQKSFEFKFFSSFVFFSSVLNITASNLVTILFSYHLLLLFCYIFSIRFLQKTDKKSCRLFAFSLYFEAILLFLAVALIYKFAGVINFTSAKEAISENVGMAGQFVIFSLCFLALLLLSIAPFFLLYSRFSNDSLTTYLLFFIALAFVPLYIFVKIIFFIFGFDAFAKLITELGFSYFEMMFLITIFASGLLLILSKDLKSAFFYILFNQFAFASLVFMAFAIFDKTKVLLPLISFSLSITLILLCLSNFILYLSKAEFKSIRNLLYELKITSVLLIFAFLNMVGIVPGLGMMQNFFLVKMMFLKELSFLGIIFIVNFILIMIFVSKMAYLLLAKVENKKSSKDLALIKTIDYDSGLMLTALVVALVILLSPIVFLIKSTLFSL
ncbi:MAG: hypothetical protein KGQ36_05080 [Rickettsiales bacterium]|nr:hypothetical protein [Rickettsiales bacterium]